MELGTPGDVHNQALGMNSTSRTSRKMPKDRLEARLLQLQDLFVTWIEFDFQQHQRYEVLVELTRGLRLFDATDVALCETIQENPHRAILLIMWKSASCFEAFRQTDHFKNTFWPPLCRLEEPYIQAFGSSSGAGNLQQWFTSNCSGTGHYTRFLQIIKVYTKTPVSDHTRFKLLKETGVWVGLVPESEEAESRYYYSQSRFPVNIWMNETETIDQGEAQVMFCIHYWTSAEAESMAMKIPLELFTEIQVSPLPTPSDQEEAAFPNREADKLELHGLFDPPSPNSSLPKCSISYMIENASFGSGTLPRERLMSQLQASEVLDWTELHAEFKRITLDRVGRPAARATGHEWSQRAS